MVKITEILNIILGDKNNMFSGEITININEVADFRANSGVLLISFPARGFYSIVGVSWYKNQIQEAVTYGISTVKDTNGKINIYKETDSSTLKIQNKVDIEITFRYWYFGSRS